MRWVGVAILLGTLAYQYCEWQARAVCFRYTDRRRDGPLTSCHPSFSGCDQRRAQELRSHRDNITEITKCDPID